MAADLSNIVSPIAKATVAAPAYTEGQPSGLSLDLLGNLRVTGSFTVAGGSTSNASSGVATSSTNEAVVAYNYGFNGTTWDQLQVDGSKFLKVAISAGTLAVTNAGTFAVQASVADGANVVEGAVADAVVAAGAAGTISAKLRAISRDIVANIVLAAGSNLIGRVVADASPATGGIPSISRLLSAAGTSGDATNVKASAGRVYFIRGTNVRISAVYLKLYNSASAPTAGSGTPVDTIYLPPSGSFVFDFPVGLTFSTGIGFTLVTGGADNSSTSVTAGDILALSIGYA